MDFAAIYKKITLKIDAQDPHTAPKDKDGNIHPASLKYLGLLHSPEEADVIQHLKLVHHGLSTGDAQTASI